MAGNKRKEKQNNKRALGFLAGGLLRGLGPNEKEKNEQVSIWLAVVVKWPIVCCGPT